MILVLGGTSDGLRIAEDLWKEFPYVVLSTATAYGGAAAADRFQGEIVTGQKNQKELEAYCRTRKVTVMVDATHPYAAEVSRNAMEACKEVGILYVRYEREQMPKEADILYCSSYEEAGKAANALSGNIFVTTGSRYIAELASWIEDRRRLIVRVLPQGKIISGLEAIGLDADQIIGMKGPFSEALNREMFQKVQAKILISKQSGAEGGEKEKIEAARKEGMKMIWVERPKLSYPVICRNEEQISRYIQEQNI